jgi:hypothetical protein
VGALRGALEYHPHLPINKWDNLPMNGHYSREELERVYDTMKDESHRGCVLVGASLIEWQMGELLNDTFLANHEDPAEEIKGK